MQWHSFKNFRQEVKYLQEKNTLETQTRDQVFMNLQLFAQKWPWKNRRFKSNFLWSLLHYEHLHSLCFRHSRKTLCAFQRCCPCLVVRFLLDNVTRFPHSSRAVLFSLGISHLRCFCLSSSKPANVHFLIPSCLWKNSQQFDEVLSHNDVHKLLKSKLKIFLFRSETIAHTSSVFFEACSKNTDQLIRSVRDGSGRTHRGSSLSTTLFKRFKNDQFAPHGTGTIDWWLHGSSNKKRYPGMLPTL